MSTRENTGSAELTRARVVVYGLFSGVLALIALLAPAAALFGLLKPEEMLVSEWFMRSGAITAVFALSAQTVAASVLNALLPKGFTCLDRDALAKTFGKAFKLIVGLGIILAIAGSLIWGYGDLFLMRAHGMICGT